MCRFRSKSARSLILLGGWCWIALIPGRLLACPNCKNAVAHSSETNAIAFAWSIGLMLMVPATIVVVWIAAIALLRRAHANEPIKLASALKTSGECV